MAKHMVICKVCNREFDAQYGAKYDEKSRRYTCPDCIAKAKAAREAKDAKKEKTIRIIAAVLALGFLWVAFSDLIAKDWTGALIGLLLTAVCAFVFFWPVIFHKIHGDKEG